MRTVVRRVLERARLEATGGPDKVERHGITMVPKNGVRVIQPQPPS
jgi:hypothetical protein